MRIRFVKQYLPVLSIVLVAATLLVIVVIFTLRTISSQYERMEEFTVRQGLSVARTLEAGTRTGLMEGDLGEQYLQKLIEQAAKDPEVEWVGLIDENGFVRHHSDPTKLGLYLDQGNDLSKLNAVIRTGEALSDKTKTADGKPVFEIWWPFTPFLEQLAQAEIVATQTVIGKEVLAVFDPMPRQVLSLGLKMDRFKEIRRRDVLYSVFMGATLFIIGCAGIYFVFVVQNSYLIRRTLDEMRTYTKNVQESMPNGLITVDQSLRTATYNTATLDILQVERTEIDGKPIGDILDVEDEVRAVLEDPAAVVEKELKTTNESKDKRFLAISVSPLKEPDSEASRGAVIILRDMTMIRELENKVALNEKFAALGRLSAGVAHEIRNPLNSIRGFIQYFRKKLQLEEEDYRYTDLMLTEVDRLNRVISKLLAYSKPRQPRLAVRGLDEILDHCVRVVEREAAERGIEVRVENSDSGSPMVLMDTDQMTQVFLNILINAVEASPSGAVINVAQETRDNLVRITITDQGPGVPRENLDKLFDPFFSTKKKGTGLGLAIVKSIIEGHGGEVEVESEVGQGTKFVVTLKPYDRHVYDENGDDSPDFSSSSGSDE